MGFQNLQTRKKSIGLQDAKQAIGWVEKTYFWAKA